MVTERSPKTTSSVLCISSRIATVIGKAILATNDRQQLKPIADPGDRKASDRNSLRNSSLMSLVSFVAMSSFNCST
jgi:hypothetical protein